MKTHPINFASFQSLGDVIGTFIQINLINYTFTSTPALRASDQTRGYLKLGEKV